MKSPIIPTTLVICLLTVATNLFAQAHLAGPPYIPRLQIDPQLDKLLDKIELRSNQLKSFQADMLFEQLDMEWQTISIRHGKTYYQADEKVVQFLIHFEDWLQKDIDDDEDTSKPSKYDEHLGFDGMWFTHLNAHTKHCLKREISKTPHNRQAFRLGKGDIPLPFAIQKKDVLKEFDVKLIPLDPKKPVKLKEPTDHLFLKPKKGSSFAQKYLSLELWISQKTSLPLQIRYRSDDFETTTVTWSNIQADKKINPATFELKPPAGWDVEITPLEIKSK
ncbi:outer membrane lipoprotein carrier protein LolA [Planctomycetota bacterium]